MKTWTTLLEGTLREQALGAVEDIARALQESQTFDSPTLSGGLAGRALFFAELGRDRPQLGHASHAERLIQQAALAIEEQPLLPWLHAGFAGIAWSIERLNTLGVHSLDDMDEIDEALLGITSRKPWGGEYDLIRGLVGLGVYALERLPRPMAARCLESIVQRLEERSTRAGPGLSWWTPSHHLPAHQRALYPEGYFNLGAAHGVPAVVALLALIARAGVAEKKARELATGGARWMLSTVLPNSPGARFASAVAPGVDLKPCRSAWCYGDPGVVLCLAVTAQALGDAELEKAALDIAREAATRPMDHAGVRDANLCHGSAGLGHIYNRLYQVSGDAVFKEAATAWFTRTLQMRRPGEGIAGFLFWTSPTGQDKDLGWFGDKSLLNGVTGTGLALLAAAQPLSPSWDGMLMASIPA
ncbi:lanthionine synthetase C family protein [Archangium primigenium]|uniref:lanthionine synthetase C family protein n=1 Tax=[Archangium] primigenium TaxID=2792470 RepID=UPI00195D9452|nr:lanthionine synthetase C family protein [Archangium primigenium]MBM7118476.1 lanthionine synthetase C family protein [Archangium primigenium]